MSDPRPEADLAGAETAPAIGRAQVAAPAAGTRIERFVVEAEIGRGGMGLVVAARDPTLDRRVAIKLLRPGAAGQEDTQGARARLVREAQSMARLAHPNVLTVHEAGQVDDRVFVVMELVDGTTIGRWVAKKSWRDILRAYGDAGRGLAAAHKAGLVHRDFKPDNVLVDRDGRVRVTDFGLAAASEEPVVVERGAADRSPAFDGLTRTGEIVGTPYYMAPEQHAGGTVDARADQFAFCVALWEALYRQRPFVASTYDELHDVVAAGAITAPPADAAVPRRLEAILRRGLSTRPADRWPDMEHLLAALADDPQRRARRRLAAAALALVVGGLALAVVLLARRGGGDGDDRPAPCTGDDEQMAALWNAPRRDALAAQFAGSKLPHAAEAAARTGAQIDGYVAAWSRMRIEACAATHVQRTQSPELGDRRAACLDQRRVHLARLLDRLASGDRATVNRASEAVAGLPPVADCADLASLLALAAPPPDPAQQARIAEVGGLVAGARAYRLTGAYADGLPHARTAAEQARALGWAPLLHEALTVVGELEMHTGKFTEAEATYHAAHQAASQAGDLAGARARMVDIADATFRQGRYPEASALIKVALGALAQADPDAQAELRAVLGNLHRAQGQWADAGRQYQQALALRDRPGGLPLAIAASHDDLGRLAIETARFDDAERHLSAALALERQLMGEHHPAIATSLANLAIVARERGKLDEATTRLQAALAIMEPAEGAASPRVGTLYTNLGVLLEAQDKGEEALAMMRRGLAVREQSLPPDHPEIADSLMNIGVALDESLHRPTEALPYFEKALAMLERKLPPAHPNLAFPLHGIGSCLVTSKKPRDALPYLERALTLRSGDDVAPTLRAATLTVLADALWDSGRDRRRAISLARDARALYVDDGDAEASGVLDRWLAARGAR